MSNPIFAQQAEIAAKLVTIAGLETVPIGTEDPKSASADVAKALLKNAMPPNTDGKAGIAMLVVTPAATATDPDMETETVFASMRHQVAIYENVEWNRGEAGIGITGLDALWLVIKGLQGWTNGPGTNPVRFVSFESDESANGAVMAYFVTFLWERELF
ncbi:MAG TPA: hypothetical protein VMF06_23195 [Candidatus Limnocylindria bacterium]|nr:hypothetical protein [Candidatus Limnocylindria bacterium]